MGGKQKVGRAWNALCGGKNCALKPQVDSSCSFAVFCCMSLFPVPEAGSR